MIVIHIDSQEDTKFLSKCYEELEKHGIDVTLFYNPDRKTLEEYLKYHPNEDVMMLGHGSPSGLFSHDWRGYIIDADNAYLLKDRDCIGIWCHAKEFGRRHGLRGYFTSMFISNEGEARCYGYSATNEDVFAEVEIFARLVRNLIIEQVPYNEWVKRLQDAADMEKDFVNYNYSAMEYFDGTQRAKDEDLFAPLTLGADENIISEEELGIMDAAFEDFIDFQYRDLNDEKTKQMMRDAFMFAWQNKDSYLW